MRTIVKAFNERDHLRNTIVPLALKAERIIFLVRKQVNRESTENTFQLFKKCLCAEILFVQVDNTNEKEKIKEIFARYPECEIDMSGSRYLLLLLFEEALKLKNKVWYYDENQNRIRSYFNRDEFVEAPCLCLDDMIALAGGRIFKKLHQQPDMNDAETNACLKKTMEKVMPQYSRFISSVSSVFKIIRAEKKKGAGYLLSETALKKLPQLAFWKEMEEWGLFSLQENKFRYRNRFIGDMFEVAGSWLESYLFLSLRESGLFEEVQMSVAIDFSSRHQERYPVTCEIDCMAIRKNRMVFISCKSNKVDSASLNEIALHNLYFGNELSKAVMATFEDMGEKNPAMVAKARELEICLLEKSDFERNVSKKVVDYLQK